MTDNRSNNENDAFAIAKDALRLIGQFKTPPTPNVYGVWYRYVEGHDTELIRKLSPAVTEAQSVSVAMLESIHSQTANAADETNASVGEALIAELDRFQSLITQQQAAGTEFEGTIDTASKLLNADDSSQQSSADCIAVINAGATAMKRQLHEASQKLDAAQSQIAKLQTELAQSRRGMMTDHLTGIGNRRYFDAQVRQTLKSLRYCSGSVYLILMDVDHFKHINDSYGHDAGDQVIRFIAMEISRRHPNVSLARLGGDEFAVILQTSSALAAVEFADQMREHFATQQLNIMPARTPIGSIRISMGLAKLTENDDEKSWYTRADGMLYRAKGMGRDQVAIEEECMQV
ncbi:putative diguanylate cyclase AdrA [Rosistilla carotiformis]|uniref:diguanylate cyclase n=1 Tax=Rosistilla carotiformis TaxID=2528017 RepID=A0A518JV48_9BACT|nr:diguanylate cyclase [Rosistilla carotiformis]QDV69420.1 putative diguanylate cyclase AdrA [Rosistilla carotiformis]